MRKKNTPNTASKPNLILLIVVIVLAVCACCATIIAVIQTIRADNPTEPTQSTVNAEELAEATRNSIAISIGDHQLNAVEFNYYYMETVNNFCNQFGSYLYYMMDVSKPLNEQECAFDETKTWADYLMDISIESIKSTYMLCDLAEEAGFTLSEEQQAYEAEMVETIKKIATQYQYASTDAYLSDVFGYGSDLESYTRYFHMTLVADAYYNHYAEALKFDDAALQEHEAKEPHLYNSYSFAYYYLDSNKFLTGGVEDSDGKVTYTDEQKKAAVDAAKEAANALLGNTCADKDAFEDLILGMEVHASLESIRVTEKKDLFSQNIDAAFLDWIIDAQRTVGEITVIPKATEDEDGNEIVEGYYIVWFAGKNDNQFFMKDIRHILITFKDDNGKTNSDGVTTFTDAQKSAAKEAIDAIKALWEAGELTEEAFAALATEKTEDPGSKATGGLYTNVMPGQMVEPFDKWCYDETRVAGNYDIIETVFGYHLIYFVGNTEMTCREYLIDSSLRNKAVNEWYDALLDSAELTVLSLDYCKLDLVLAPG